MTHRYYPQENCAGPALAAGIVPIKKRALADNCKRGLAALAATVIIGGTGLTMTACPSPTNGGTEQTDEYDKDGYDVNGYDRDGYNKAGYNAAGYDRDGYNAIGWNAKGWNKDGSATNINGTHFDDDDMARNGTPYYDGYDVNGYDELGYDENGFDSDDNPQPIADIAPFGFAAGSMNVPFFGGLGLDSLQSVGYSLPAQGGVNLGLKDAATNLRDQSGNLVNGYTAVKAKYAELSTILDGIIGAETDMKNTAGTIVQMGNYNTTITPKVDQILTAVFGAAGSENAVRIQFEKDLAAYQAGNYLDKKQRFGDNINNPSSDPDFADVFDDFVTKVAAAGGLNSPYQTSGARDVGANIDYYGDYVGNMGGILAALKTRLTSAIDTAMGVGEIENTTNQSRVRELNGYLVTQIGEDTAQLQATVDDVTDIGYNVQVSAIAVSKASRLNESFGTGYLREQPMLKEEYIRAA